MSVLFLLGALIPTKITDYKKPLPDIFTNRYSALVSKAERLYYSGQYQRAKGYYEDLINNSEAPGKRLVGFIGNGWCLIHMGRYHEAIDTFRKAEILSGGRKPAVIPLYMGLGIAYYNIGRYLDAYRYFKALTRYPEYEDVYRDALYFAALSAYMNGSYSNVISLVDELQRRFPNTKKANDAAILKVFAYRKKGELFKAITELKRLIEKGHPKKPKFEIILAEWYAEYGDYPKAIQQYEKALANYPFLKDTILASLAYVEKKYGDNIALAPNLKVTNPLVGEILFYKPGMEAYKKGQMTKAQQRFERFIQFFPDDPRSAKLVAYLGQLLFQAGSYEKAKEKLEYYLKKYPEGEDRPAVLELLGKVYYRLKDYRRAAEVWDQFLREYPGHKNAENVKKLLQALIAERPEVAQYVRSEVGAEAVFNKALAAYKQGAYPKALKLFAQFIKLFPNSQYTPKATFNAGYIAYQMKEYDTAITYFSQYVQKFPNGEDIENALYLLALAHFAKNDYDNAIAYLTQFVQTFTNSDKLADAYKFLGFAYYKKYESGDETAKANALIAFQNAAKLYRSAGKTKEAQQMEQFVKQLGG
ncbi:MAG: tetratricopeptide repeat protein [Thermotogae bacterium]|nr:tetratricopeptide repeat protein [Thermotogota bacterium]